MGPKRVLGEMRVKVPLHGDVCEAPGAWHVLFLGLGSYLCVFYDNVLECIFTL